MKTGLKRIDTTVHYGRAEGYLSDADFKGIKPDWLSVNEIIKTDILEIQKKYNLRGFVFGNFVGQEERYYSVFLAEKYLSFLAKISGKNDLGKGQLIIGIGSDGKGGSLAHFNPNKSFINLNKGHKERGVLTGINSFIHEYGHFIDFQAGRADQNTPFNFASENYVKDPNYSPFTQFVSIAAMDPEYTKNLRTKYLRSTVEIYARLFEKTVVMMAQKDPTYAKFFRYRYNDERYYPDAKLNASKAKSLIKKMIVQGTNTQLNLF